MPLARVFENPYSQAFSMFYSLISPPLPSYLIPRLSYKENNRPLLRLFFQEEAATVPFISQTSRELQLDINILLANIDRFDTVTCGVLVVELQAPPTLLATFIERCKQAKLTVEIVGYVSDPVI
jgi:D-methionine transport system ATP-binding protein